MQPRVVKPPGQDFAVERLKSRYGLGGGCPSEVRPRGLLALPGARPGPAAAPGRGEAGGGSSSGPQGCGRGGSMEGTRGKNRLLQRSSLTVTLEGYVLQIVLCHC